MARGKNLAAPKTQRNAGKALVAEKGFLAHTRQGVMRVHGTNNMLCGCEQLATRMPYAVAVLIAITTDQKAFTSRGIPTMALVRNPCGISCKPGQCHASSNKCLTTRNRCFTSSNKKLLEAIIVSTSFLLLLVRHLFLVARHLFLVQTRPVPCRLQNIFRSPCRPSRSDTRKAHHQCAWLSKQHSCNPLRSCSLVTSPKVNTSCAASTLCKTLYPIVWS